MAKAAEKNFLLPKKDAALRVRKLSKSFSGQQVLKNISFDIGKGMLVSLIGSSGCGKTTLLRCLNFLETPDKGEIAINELSFQCSGKWGREQEKKSHSLRAKTGMVFQSFNLFPHLTVLQNIILAPVHVQKRSSEEATAQAKRLLEKVGLAEMGGRHPESLSGGQKQRVAIARALATSPAVMFYDEPTSALDPERSEEVRSVLRDLNQEGMTQLVVTHDMRFAKNASDYVIFIEEGQIVEIGKPEQIFVNPEHERTRRFLRTVLG
ncbi:amino acid ABC transporter ATP-binding protein [Acetobacteraceae bacterium]|nr:amino acid ABC transporter ATP-binding protein [Acetobacteraceae bacterium]